jgi:two-component system nitrogen regulation response regulator NtrX
MTANIIILDDEADIRDALQGILEDEGYAIRQAGTVPQFFTLMRDRAPDLAILDIWLQGSAQDGMDVLAKVKETHPDIPVVMISGHGTIETAVLAIKQGAYDFIEKPFEADRLLLMIERALETARLRRENRVLKAQTEGTSDLIGESSALLAVRQMLSRVAQTNSRVLITGEAGTGKDVAARQIHKLSARAEGPFKVVNCAVLRPEHLESELFGAEKPGEPVMPGMLEQANGGTLLLDEVADMPLETQGKIVRALQEQHFTRVGGQTPIEVDVRILASTNRDLQALMEQGRFRQDLFYRLSVVPIALPPLRERPHDIPLLADYFIRQFSSQSGLPPCTLAASTLVAMQHYEWPGNVRQLRNAIEWVMIMYGGESAIRPDHLPPELTSQPQSGEHADMHNSRHEMLGLPLREAREYFERDYLASQVHRFGGNISKTAEFIGMERSALHRKMKQLGIVAGGKAAEEEHEGGDETERKSA